MAYRLEYRESRASSDYRTAYPHQALAAYEEAHVSIRVRSYGYDSVYARRKVLKKLTLPHIRHIFDGLVEVCPPAPAKKSAGTVKFDDPVGEPWAEAGSTCHDWNVGAYLVYSPHVGSPLQKYGQIYFERKPKKLVTRETGISVAARLNYEIDV